MDKSQQWILVFTGEHFSAKLLLHALDSKEIQARVVSDSESALLAGFGSSGFTRIMVRESDSVEAEKIVAEFQNRIDS